MSKTWSLAACNTLARRLTRLRKRRLTPRSRPGRRCRNIETRPPPTPSTRGFILDTYAEIPHCFWALRFFLSFFRTSDNVRSFHVLFWSLQGLRGAFPSKRSEWPRNRKRDHPRPSFLETSHINKVKAPQHVKTPRYYRFPMYLPDISRKAFAQSKGSIKDINA